MGVTGPTIRLNSVRPIKSRLVTICHELGHFWSYARNFRDQRYEDSLDRFNKWYPFLNHEVLTLIKARGLNPKTVSDEVRVAVISEVAAASDKKPTAEECQLILAEELRAWHFGSYVAEGLAIDSELFATTANSFSGLRPYFEALRLPPFEWKRGAWSYSLDDTDRKFCSDLTTALVNS